VAGAARSLRVDGTVLITVATNLLLSQSIEFRSIATEPRLRHMFVTSNLTTIMNVSLGVLRVIFNGTALSYSSLAVDQLLSVLSHIAMLTALTLLQTNCCDVSCDLVVYIRKKHHNSARFSNNSF